MCPFGGGVATWVGTGATFAYSGGPPTEPVQTSTARTPMGYQKTSIMVRYMHVPVAFLQRNSFTVFTRVIDNASVFVCSSSQFLN
jgi:hypothetical protein